MRTAQQAGRIKRIFANGRSRCEDDVRAVGRKLRVGDRLALFVGALGQNDPAEAWASCKDERRLVALTDDPGERRHLCRADRLDHREIEEAGV